MVASGLALGLLTVIVVGAAGAGAYMSWNQMTTDLPDYANVEALEFETTKIYDRNWRLLHEVSDPLTGWRTSISYDELAENVQRYSSGPNAPERAWIIDATVAAEDSTFWTNEGVDPTAIARSLFVNLSGGPASGASTITQQLVRNMFPESIGQERSYTRKLREAVMAYQFTQRYDKEEIMEMYLNNVYYGNRAYGIDAASQAYFNTFAWELSLAQASMLAGLPQAPSLYDPNNNYELAKARQRYVLDRMVIEEMITQAEADEAYEEPLTPQRRENRYDLAPHFVNYARYEIERRYGAEALLRGGLMVRTTLDYELYLEAQELVRQHIESLGPWNVDNGALVAMLPWSGEIVAMVGSADFYNDAIDGQVNVTVRERQPGSSIKPITYLAALEAGWHPGTVIFDYAKQWDTPLAPEPVYAPRNATGQFYGAISMREALGNSLNIPAVQALDFVGVGEMIRLANAMGIRTGLWRGLDYYGLAITLGGGEVTLLEHTNAFATIANNGRYVPYTPFIEIINPDGARLYDLDRGNAYSRGTQVVRPEHAYQVTDILSDNSARSMIFGANSPLVIPELGSRPVSAKTGTTDDSRDGWSMGYTTEIVTGVWVGNTDNSPTRSLDGIAGAAPLWHDFMRLVHTDERFADLLLDANGRKIPEEFPRPPGIIEAQVCTATGKRPIAGSQSRTEVLVDGGGPQLRCDQMSEFEEQELIAAIEDARGNPSFTGRGIQTLDGYARMVGIRARVIPEVTPQPTPPVIQDDSDGEDAPENDSGGDEAGTSDGAGSDGGGSETGTGDGGGDGGESDGEASGETD
jgi:membrane peptidoglycan carboxypeptidase